MRKKALIGVLPQVGRLSVFNADQRRHKGDREFVLCNVIFDATSSNDSWYDHARPQLSG